MERNPTQSLPHSIKGKSNQKMVVKLSINIGKRKGVALSSEAKSTLKISKPSGQRAEKIMGLGLITKDFGLNRQVNQEQHANSLLHFQVVFMDNTLLGTKH